MATATATPVLTAPLPPPSGRSGILGALRSEWTKIRSVRSTMWTLLATCAVTIGISTLFAWGASTHLGQEDLKTFDPVRQSMFGIVFGQLAIVVIGAMTMSSEYSTGMVRTSLTSMPRRGVVFSAKLAVITAVTLAAGLFCSFVSFFIGQSFFSDVTCRTSARAGTGSSRRARWTCRRAWASRTCCGPWSAAACTWRSAPCWPSAWPRCCGTRPARSPRPSPRCSSPSS